MPLYCGNVREGKRRSLSRGNSCAFVGGFWFGLGLGVNYSSFLTRVKMTDHLGLTLKNTTKNQNQLRWV
jgi:hypothetical protein